MPSRGRPEFLQLCAFITVVVSPIQLNFDRLDLVLLWQRDSVVNVGRNLIARPGERDLGVEIEAALLQLGRAPIFIGGASVAPCVRRISIPGIRITASHCGSGRGCGLVSAANQ